MQTLGRRSLGLLATLFWIGSSPLEAQTTVDSAAAPVEAPAPPVSEQAPDAGPPESTSGGEPEPLGDTAVDAGNEAAPVEPPQRGDTPVSVESVVNPNAAPEAEQPAAQEPATRKPESAAQPPVKETKPRSDQAHEPREPAAAAPLIAWAAADWAGSLGPARCGARGLEGADLAIKIGSTLKHSVAQAGLGIAPAGALADHPLIAYAAKHAPEQLADLLAEVGFGAIVLGIADVNGPLLREPKLSEALRKRGIWVIASNLECGRQAFCAGWATADRPAPILERGGKRYALIGLLPDDLPARVEPAGGRTLSLRAAADTLIEQTARARADGADLIVASIDHGPDATASSEVTNFLAELPPDVRPDLLFSPSAGESTLFLRPLDVQPAVVGTRAGVLTGLRVTKLPNSNDADVFARSVRLSEVDSSLAERVRQLGASFCAAKGGELPGGRLSAPLSSEELVELAANSAREVAGTDLAVVDPLVYDAGFVQPRPVRLQRGQMERAVLLDSTLVTATVSLDWLGNLKKKLDGLRPLKLIGVVTDDGSDSIAGRAPVIGAKYRVVTSSVLAQSGRLPNDVTWRPVDAPAASLRGALLAHLEAPSTRDPRDSVRDPTQSTQWVFRADGSVQANLTEVKLPGGEDSPYEEPALLVNDSRQLGVRLVINLDADAPKFLFENGLQIGFDRNFTTSTTAEDLSFFQTTYTYRGLWPKPLLYPHPFAEGYVESEFETEPGRNRHLLLRPKLGLRSMISRVLSFKLSAGFQYTPRDPDDHIYPGLGAELVLKPWTAAVSGGSLQMEGNITYYWNSPGNADEHTLRGQLISALTLFGPLQLTLTALAAFQRYPGLEAGRSIAIQAGIRLRFVARTMDE